jgi:hypothetical protein
VDSLRIAAMVDPGGPLAGVRAALAPSPLWRAKADIYRLHGDFVAGMTPPRARGLIELGTRLSRAAPKGERVASHVHPGR